ncbi:Fe-S cluster assembly scaffold protein SufB [Aequitasia blattaphilus]|uniref:SufD family Fe-S cluster assembly protein n=1 Tax=Aequitasia blattaphilus TaxID=2949332 RepID=A0ABT1EDH5_9FIRM|nr:SufD family Fe-S cluster assembly protein [Aequitasia blattaphilus]MCP1103704.1 SufD family Fe-S cluster assembly protein [Aequitasia blattaphilus]MCR8616344.1 SufD family Fe-S cluster assembly protein [Aequitasia blattaphilus]
MSNIIDQVADKVLEIVSGLKETPKGAFNIRVNGKGVKKSSSKNIQIVSKKDKEGIDIIVAPGTKGETVHIPVVLDHSGTQELVYNDFYIGEGSDVLIVAGCGIHNDGSHLTQHDGIHSFYLDENASVKYVEKHYGEGTGDGKNVLNPITNVHLKKGAFMELETVQIEGVDSTDRETNATLAEDSKLVVKEKLLTNGKQEAITRFNVDLDGENSSANVMSRSVAKGDSKQYFYSVINGNNKCAGHSECDAIIMDNGFVKAVPDVTANHVDASLIHEAAIGKIAGEQLIKLESLGLSEEEAEARIVEGFLR